MTCCHLLAVQLSLLNSIRARTLFFVRLTPPTALQVSQVTAEGNCRQGALRRLLCLCCCYSHSCHRLLALNNDDVQLQAALQLIICTVWPRVRSPQCPQFSRWKLVIMTGQFQNVGVAKMYVFQLFPLSDFFMSFGICQTERVFFRTAEKSLFVSVFLSFSVCPPRYDLSDLILPHSSAGSSMQHLDTWRTHRHAYKTHTHSLHSVQQDASALCKMLLGAIKLQLYVTIGFPGHTLYLFVFYHYNSVHYI